MRVLLSVVALLLAIFTSLYLYGVPDGHKFCAKSDKSGHPSFFRFDEAGKGHVNLGGKACIEDIVSYISEFRAGPDGLVGTQDDRITLEEEFELIPKLLKQEFKGGYWPMSAWHFNHNAAVLGQMKLLYSDGNEYILIFGNPIASNGYSGKYPYDCYDFQIQGEQRNFILGNTSYTIYSPNWRSLREEGHNAHFSMVLKAGQQKGYAQPDGGWMVEYGYGNLVPALYDGVLMPTMFTTNDWTSLCTSLGSFTEGVLANNAPWLARLLGFKNRSKWN